MPNFVFSNLSCVLVPWESRLQPSSNSGPFSTRSKRRRNSRLHSRTHPWTINRHTWLRITSRYPTTDTTTICCRSQTWNTVWCSSKDTWAFDNRSSSRNSSFCSTKDSGTFHNNSEGRDTSVCSTKISWTVCRGRQSTESRHTSISAFTRSVLADKAVAYIILRCLY